MLQFIAKENDRYTIPELVQMAIEGGCKWVQLHLPDMTDDDIRELASELVPLCKETSTILTIEDHVDLAKELAIHGVLLVEPNDVRQVREYCGPEAIIGVQISEASAALQLRNLDIDYIALAPDMPIGRVSEYVEAIRNAEVMQPLVAAGDYSIRQLPEIIATNVNGVALGAAIADAKDPVSATEEIIQLLTNS